MLWITAALVGFSILPSAMAREGIDCFSMPYDSRCTGFTMSERDLDLIAASICGQYPGVPACYFRARCVNYKPWVVEACSPSKIVSVLCADKPELSECGSYLRLCRGNSVVSQCFSHRNIPGAPSLLQAMSSVEALCSRIGSNECKNCIKSDPSKNGDLSTTCKYINVWAKLCEDPRSRDMFECMNLAKQCSTYKGFYEDVVADICLRNETVFSREDSIPLEAAVMFSKSYFHFSTRGYFLLKSLYVRTKAHLVLSIIACIGLGIISFKALGTYVQRNGYSLSETDSGSDYDGVDAINQYYPSRCALMVKKILTFLKRDMYVPGVITKILGNFIETMLIIPLIATLVMIMASGNLIWIFFTALGVCVWSF